MCIRDSPYRGTALMHVIGPIEMDYRRMVSLVNVISRVLVMKLTDYYRYLNSNHYEVFLSRNVLKMCIRDRFHKGDVAISWICSSLPWAKR